MIEINRNESPLKGWDLKKPADRKRDRHQVFVSGRKREWREWGGGGEGERDRAGGRRGGGKREGVGNCVLDCYLCPNL